MSGVDTSKTVVQVMAAKMLEQSSMFSMALLEKSSDHAVLASDILLALSAERDALRAQLATAREEAYFAGYDLAKTYHYEVMTPEVGFANYARSLITPPTNGE